jgi:20S proteasome subunit beta 4
MDSVFGISGRDFVLLAADTSQARSIVVLKTDDDKIMKLDDYKLFAMAGENGDRTAFCEYIQKNLHLYYYRNDLKLSTRAAANYTRKELAEALRSDPYNVNLLLAGFDEEDGASLYFIDYLSSMSKVPFGAHGYAGFFLSGLLDRYWQKDMNREQVLALADRCINELQTRLLVAGNNFTIKIVDKDGIQVVKAASS